MFSEVLEDGISESLNTLYMFDDLFPNPFPSGHSLYHLNAEKLELPSTTNSPHSHTADVNSNNSFIVAITSSKSDFVYRSGASALPSQFTGSVSAGISIDFSSYCLRFLLLSGWQHLLV